MRQKQLSQTRLHQVIGISAFMIAAVASVYFLVAGILTDFWLDEIWSYSLVGSSQSVWDLFYKVPHDNNHILNSVVMYLIGDSYYWFPYRYGPAFMGLGTLVLLVMDSKTWAQRTVSLAVFGGSFFFLQLFTEARGYSYAIFFALFSFRLDQHSLDSWTHTLLLNVALILGFLSHFTFAFFVVALATQRLFDCARNRGPWKTIAYRYSLPLFCIAVYYLTYIQKMLIGGASPLSSAELYSHIFAQLANVEPTPWITFLSIAALTALWVTAAEKRFFYAILFLAPVFYIEISHPTVLAPRYFAIPAFFGLYLFRSWLFALEQRRSIHIAYALLILTVSSNLIGIRSFLSEGRGDFRGAFSHIIRNNSAKLITLSSDHDFRNGMLLQYYKRFYPITPLKYVSTMESREGLKSVDWLIGHHSNRNHEPQSKLQFATSRGPIEFELEKQFRFASLTGTHWFLFKRVATSKEAPRDLEY